MHSTTIYQELRIIGIAGLLIIVLSSLFIELYNTTIKSLQYFGIATSLWFFGWWQTWKRADLNRPDKDSFVFPNLGWANNLTLFRGGLIALTGGFLLQPTLVGLIAWLPGLIYGLAAMLDRIDGFVARRTNRSSLLGSELDTLFDALGLLVAPVLAIQLGKVHWSFLGVSVAYYLFIFGLYWRQKNQRPSYALLPSQLRRAFAGIQMGFVALVLFPVFSANITRLLGVAFMLPILIGFFIDWLVVSGRIDGTHQNTQTIFARIDQLSENILQPALRFTIGLLVLSLLLFNNQLFDANAFGIALSTTSAIGLSMLAILIITGTGARIAAFILLITSSFLFSQAVIIWYQAMLLLTTSWLLLLGPGNYCLWRGDDIWINRQDGAK